ncbi:MAG: Rne/Rng family ribonuclease [Planctomycetes bacterium]|nr:Rne/Rng family ribonuclease [Planctomycetota bacterium]
MKRMLINAIDPEESRIAVVEDGVLQELHVELANREAYLGNIYKGKVVNIEPSIGAAFVAFGGRVNGFLHVSDVLPAYGRPEFMLEDVIEGRARVSVDDGPESMQQALADDEDDDGGGRSDGDGIEPVHADQHVETVGHDHEPGGGDAGAGPGATEPPLPDDGHAHGDDHVGDGPADERPLAMAASPVDDGEPGGEDPADTVFAPRDGARSRRRDRADGRGEADGAPPDAAGQGDPGDGEPAERQGTGGDDETGDADADRRDRVGEVDHDDAPRSGDAVASDEPGAHGQGEGGGGRRDRRRGRDRNGSRDRGRDDDRRPRRPRPTIDQLLRKGQEVVVQITKEGIGSKGPTLTTYVSLPGRCLVLMPSLPKCGVSRKIEDSRERRRLKRIVRELDETGAGGIGFIVRTAGINKTLQDLERDRDYLKKIWEMVAQRLKVTRAPALLYQESDLVLKAMRDLFTPDIAEVVVDSEDVFLRIKDFAEKLMPHMADRIRLHPHTTPLYHSFGIEKEVEALYQPKVDLPNGASVVIDQTEALVAIDVNSGKFKPGADLEETAYRTNSDAIPEIVRQLRLRDLGGLIIIDFIDMAAEKHRRGIEKRLIESLRGDRARIKVGRISPFGMLEITRQRVGPGLKRTVFMQCPHCKGAGWSRTVQSKALQVLREVRALLNLKGYSVLQVFGAPAVNDYLVNYKRRPVLDLEDATGKTVMFRPELSYPIDVVHYRFLTGDGQEARVAIPAGLGVKA